MKKLNSYKDIYGVNDEPSVFSSFMGSLKPSNMLWSHFVNWDKVLKNIEEIEVELNTLNYLVGKKDFDKSFRTLINKHPNIVTILPALAVRVGDGLKNFDILANYEKGRLEFENYDFTLFKERDIDKYIEFLEGTGVKKLLQDKKVKNLVDYMIGVEAGLDSNGRKNRAGSTMEMVVEVFIKDFCNKKKYRYIKEANAETIKSNFGYVVPVDKQNRRYDFVVDNGKKPIIFEVNFYNSKGGSKLKATAGEYIGLNNILKEKNIDFIWITDGPGWKSVKRGLREAFTKMNYIFNLDQLEKGILVKEF